VTSVCDFANQLKSEASTFHIDGRTGTRLVWAVRRAEFEGTRVEYLKDSDWHTLALLSLSVNQRQIPQLVTQFGQDRPAAEPNVNRPRQAVLGAVVSNPVAVLIKDNRYTGVRVYGVLIESAAAQAGLKKDDIVLEVDGVVVTSASQLISEVRRHKPGETITIKFFREPVDDIQSATATLEGTFADTGPLQTAGAVLPSKH